MSPTPDAMSSTFNSELKLPIGKPLEDAQSQPRAEQSGGNEKRATPLRLGSRCPKRRRHALIGPGFILEKSWTFPEGQSPTGTSRRNFSFSTTLSRPDGIARASVPVDSERFRSTPRTGQIMLGIRRHQPSPVRRASALTRKACHHDPATTDRGSCRSICRNALSNWVLRESHSRRRGRFGFMHTRIRSARIIRDRNRSYCGRAQRSEPRSMGARVAGRPTSILHLAPRLNRPRKKGIAVIADRR